MYARYTVCQLVRHGYQTRVGQCTAGNYGCAQVSMGVTAIAMFQALGCHTTNGHDSLHNLGLDRRKKLVRFWSDRGVSLVILQHDNTARTPQCP